MLCHSARRVWRRAPSLLLRSTPALNHYRLLPPPPSQTLAIASVSAFASGSASASTCASASLCAAASSLPSSTSPFPHTSLKSFSTKPTSPSPSTPSSSPPPAHHPARKRRVADDVQEFKARAATGSMAMFDTSLAAPAHALVFPRIKTTSLSTKCVVIHDEARRHAATLVLVAFRRFADEQLQSWKDALGPHQTLMGKRVPWYDVTINESFGAQALSGFIQRLQRGRTDAGLHDFMVAFNSKAREPLEMLLPSRNRMFGYALLLDRQARVRFRASGMPSEEALQAFLACTKQLIKEDAAAASSE